MILLLIPFGVISLVIPEKASLAIMIIFKTNVPCLGMFVMLFAFSDYLYGKFKLLNEQVSPKIPILREKYV